MDYIIKNPFDEEIENLYQWDKNQTIDIILKPGNKFKNISEVADQIEVHFYNTKSKKATVVSGELNKNTITVMIPNELLQEGLDISFYVYMIKEDVENTIASGEINVIERIEKEDIIP